MFGVEINKKFKTNLQNVNKYLKEYCSKTTIHGFHYFAENRTFFEKIFWCLALILSVTCLGLMINQIVTKFITSPVVISFTTRETPVHVTPFPTVTICSQARISKQYFEYTKVMNKIRNNESLIEEEKDGNNFASLFCKDKFKKRNITDKFYNKTVNEDLFEFLKQSKRNFLHYCSWMGITVKCRDIFTPVLTPVGVCYSFNMLNGSNMFRENVNDYPYFYNNKQVSSWDLEKGYANSSDLEAYPYRALMAGSSKSLHVILYSQRKDVDKGCSGVDTGGYEVFIDIPSKLPRRSENFFTVPSNSSVTTTVTPTVISTSEGIKNFDPVKRDCFLQNEKHLKYFRNYSQGNCFLECLTNITLNKCGCVDFSMPRTPETPICGSGSYSCVDLAQKEYLLKHLFENIENIDHCTCMPMCSDINYNLEVAQNRWRNIQIIKNKKNYIKSDEDWKDKMLYIDDGDIIDISSVTIFIKRNHLETKERSSLYGFTDFLSNFGGLLGLFTGFSILSVCEVIYFLTLRILGNYKLFGNWYGAD